jgi:hypothetical protein
MITYAEVTAVFNVYKALRDNPHSDTLSVRAAWLKYAALRKAWEVQQDSRRVSQGAGS